MLTRPLLLVAALLTAATAAAPAARAAADDPFSPTITLARGTDAARAPTNLHLEVNQPDGEQQIGLVDLLLPGASEVDLSHGFALATDVPGSNGAQIGTVAVSFYTDPRPVGSLDITGTVHDDNDACDDPDEQCVLVKAFVPGVGEVEFRLGITVESATGDYVISGDISDVWNDPYVRGLDARLKKLVVDVPAAVSAPGAPGDYHVLFRNPAVAGNFDMRYWLTSAAIGALGHAGGASPACGQMCMVPLPSKEYAPTQPVAVIPAHGSITTSSTDITLHWSAANDANGDPITYSVDLQGPTTRSLTQSATTVALGTLPPGAYTWSVTATETSPVNLTSGFSGAAFTVLDAADAIRFTSGADTLMLFPAEDIVVLRRGGDAIATELSFSHVVNEDRGTISYDSPVVKLQGAYDVEARSAVLAIVPSTGAPSTFTDLPG